MIRQQARLGVRSHAMRTVRALWVGLVLSVPLPAAAQQALALTGRPTSATVRLRPGFRPDPGTVRTTAGGATQHPSCQGFVSARPNVVVNVTAAVPFVRVYAAGSGDTTLHLLGPDGQWRCADDTFGVHPGIDGPLPVGTWRLWVGTHAAGPTVRALVTVTAANTRQPSTTPAAPTAPTAPARPAANPQGALGALAQQAVNVLTGTSPTTPTTPAQPPTAPTTPTQPSPLQLPTELLTRAGLDPQRLPGSLDTLLRQPSSAGTPVTAPQLGQLGQLSQAGLSAGQLATVMSALTRASSGGATPTFTPDQLGQLGQLARNGAQGTQLANAVAGMLGGR
jgi:hypothetical protein